jgi:tRNA 2-selenouridine synthase
MTDKPNDSLFRRIFIEDIPLMDTRSPSEFSKGSFPAALNLPLMLDDERAKVGTCYKQQGQEVAIALGHKLVAGEVKQQRVHSWQQFTQAHPQGYLFCWRGGLRSQIVQSWLQEEGVDYPRIPGGYKALRRFLIEQTADIVKRLPLVLLAGGTGSGKTALLNTLANSIDLEGLAHHRGSSFGQRPDGQPGQILFENKLAIALLKQTMQASAALVLEDESSFIGSCSLPLSLFQKMKVSPRVLVDVPLGDRVETILNDYIINLYSEYVEVLGEQGRQRFVDMLRSGLQRLSKRLGSEAYMSISAMLEQALKAQFDNAEVAGHRLWIRELLVNYYDPSYNYQLSRQQQSILFKGNKEEVLQWFEHHYQVC